MSSFSIPGLGSGIDWGAYIQSIRDTQEKALGKTLGKQSNKLTGTTTELTNVQSLAETFRSNVRGFAFAKDFLTKSVSSSDSTVVTGAATLSAINQTNTIDVRQLATNEVWQASFTGTGDSVSSTPQTLTITVRGKANVLNVNAGTTLSQLADQINAANIGLNASVFNTGDGGATPARLSITDTTSGKASADQTAGINFNLGFSSTLTDLNTAAFGVNPVVEGKDSKVRLNGGTQDIYRDGNTLSDVLPGVTVNLVSADSGVWKTLTVSSSTESASTRVQDFINKYNSLLKELKKALKFDPKLAAQGLPQTNPTAGNSALRSVLTQLQSAALASVTTLPENKTIRSLSDLGITSRFTSGDSENSGYLDIDTAKFSTAMADHFDDAVSFFEGVTAGSIKYDGFSQKLSDLTDTFLDSTSGTIPSELKTVATQNLRISDQIQKKLDQIQRQEDLLKDRFARLESQLAALGNQGKQLTAALDGLSSAKKK